MPLPKICPHCNAGYIKYFGLGTEKVENELARIFPQARIGNDILVTTAAVINRPELEFNLVGVLAVDNALNRVDFAATEKIFYLLAGVVNLSAKKVIIQSANVNHHIFQALINNDPEVFYQQELKSRKQLGLPPYKHTVLLKIRGAELEKVKKSAQEIFQRLNNIKSSPLKLLSLGPGEPAKLRGNFYYQIFTRTANLEKSCNFLKLHLKERHFLGIIVTVDVDPV
jgi:primosomal protein N' (replication factor Y)